MILAGGGELFNAYRIWKCNTALVVLNEWLEERQANVGR